MINTNRKQWINTSVEYQWSDELGKLVQISKEGYWYEGEMSLAVGQTIAHSQSSDWSLIVKNSYDTESAAIKDNPGTDGSAAANTDLGFVNLADDGDTVLIWTCFMKECTDSTSLVSNEVEIE